MPRFYSRPQRLGFSCKCNPEVPLAPGPNRLMALSSDIAYYGVNLNQSVILKEIGFADGPTPWVTLRNTAIGNIIVQVAVRCRKSPSRSSSLISGLRKLTKYRATFLDTSVESPYPIFWDALTNSSTRA